MNIQNVEQGNIGINSIGGEVIAPALSVADAFNGEGFHPDQPVIPTVSAVAGLQNTSSDPGYAYSITAHDLNDPNWADNSNFLDDATGEMWALDTNAGIVGFGGKPVKAFLANGTTPFPDVGGGDDLYTPAIANKNFAYQPSQSNSVPLVANQGNESYNANDAALEVGTNFRAIKGVSIADLSDPNGEAVMKNVANGYDLGIAGLANSGATIISDPWAALWQDVEAWGGVAVAPAQDISTSGGGGYVDMTSPYSAPIIGSQLFAIQSDDPTKSRGVFFDYMNDGANRALQVSLRGFNGDTVSNVNPIIITTASAQTTDNYTTTGSGATVNATAVPKQNFTYTVNPVGGTVTLWDVRLEESLDGGTWTQISQHTNATGAGVLLTVTGKPATYYRTRCAGITLGTGSGIDVPVLAL